MIIFCLSPEGNSVTNHCTPPPPHQSSFISKDKLLTYHDSQLIFPNDISKKNETPLITPFLFHLVTLWIHVCVSELSVRQHKCIRNECQHEAAEKKKKKASDLYFIFLHENNFLLKTPHYIRLVGSPHYVVSLRRSRRIMAAHSLLIGRRPSPRGCTTQWVCEEDEEQTELGCKLKITTPNVRLSSPRVRSSYKEGKMKAPGFKNTWSPKLRKKICI